MSVVDFMRDLVANPVQLARYKQDPVAYLKGTDLEQKDQEMLHKLTASSPAEEVSTVMRVNAPANVWDFAIPPNIPPGSIDLGGVQVTLTSPRTIFLAEKTEVPVQCRLLAHSYLHIDQELKAFGLHICYVSPTDPNDIPFVLQIETDEAVLDPTYNLADVMISFVTINYVLVLADVPLKRLLAEGSYYDPAKHLLSIEIYTPESPEGNDA